MIVIYINGEGTAEKLSPQHVYQGSNQTGVTVFAPVPQTTALGIAFRLPDKTSTTYYPMTFIQSAEGLSQYEFTIPSSITQLAGQASIALRALFSDGQQTSQLIEFEIEPSVLPTLPEDIDQDAYDIIMQRLQEDRSDITTIQGQINGIEETADSAQKASAEAVETANEAKTTADGLADSIAKANTTADNAEKIANEAVANIAEFKQSVDVEIEGFERKLDTFEEQLSETGTIVKIAGESQKEVAFDSDPQEQLDSLKSTEEEQQAQLNSLKSTDEEQQTQLDEKVNKSGDTMTGVLNIVRDSSGDTGIKPARTDIGHSMLFGIGNGGENRGIYDNTLDKWVYHVDANGKVYANGIATDFLLRTDPTKLTPTTANGWTVGANKLTFPSPGVYLLSINELPPSLIIYSGISGSHSWIISSTVPGEFYLTTLHSLSVGWLSYKCQGRGTVFELSYVETTSVAYKKLA